MINKTQLFQSALHSPNVNQIKNIPSIKVNNKILGELCTVSYKKMYNNETVTALKNRFGKTLGSESFYFEENNPNITGTLISVEPEYRQKNYRFGEILRLSSIIMMLKNNIQNLEIYSKKTAVFFHAKYKFEPAITQFSERNSVLKDIITNCKNDYENIKSEAQQLLEKALENKEPNVQRELCIKTNQLLNKYLTQILKTKDEYKKHPLDSGLSMKLTRKNIIENKDFFNQLFKKHGIDYEI